MVADAAVEQFSGRHSAHRPLDVKDAAASYLDKIKEQFADQDEIIYNKFYDILRSIQSQA